MKAIPMKFIFFLLLLPLFSFIQSHDAFLKVIQHANTQTLKNKLIDYEKAGIEHSLYLSKDFSCEAFIKVAKSYLNTPHVMGGTSHKGIDCSGLVYATLKEFGMEMPHSSHEQGRYGEVIDDFDNLVPGDLVFFYGSYNTSKLITHTGIYMGDGNYIHASAQSGVVITNIPKSEYWNSRFLFGTRLTNNQNSTEHPTMVSDTLTR